MKELEGPQKSFATLIPSALKDEGAPVFEEPWQAQAFAMTIALFEQGLFTWDEWAETLGGVIANARDQDDKAGTRYYDFWLQALETIVTAKGAAVGENLTALKEAWAEAYRTTPHGNPVELKR